MGDDLDLADIYTSPRPLEPLVTVLTGTIGFGLICIELSWGFLIGDRRMALTSMTKSLSRLDSITFLILMMFVLPLMTFLLFVTPAEGRRYRYCSEGCCLHEYCAYHKICYPKIHCGLGCPDGICQQDVCMPSHPCNASTICGLGHACLYHFNLGYSVCQYNLDIGKSLCVDRNGRSILKPFS
ncbi:hypothetical protein ACOMHN_002574 [Nucella lapillus]